MCKSQGENLDHLLLYCKVVCRLWRVTLNWFEMQWVMPGSVREALQSWTHRSRGDAQGHGALPH